MDFSTYTLSDLRELRGGVYDLADGVLQDIAARFNYELEDVPTQAGLRGFIGAVAPKKTLQDNIAYAKETLGIHAVDMAGAWLEHSGIMNAVSGAFSAPVAPLPERVDAAVLRGNVANWQLRHLMQMLRLSPNRVDTVIMAIGNRPMARGEHQLVATFIDRHSRPPTEYEFSQYFVVPLLEDAGHNVHRLPVESTNGDVVCGAVFENYPWLVDGTVLAVGNAPNTIQTAGQLRAAGRRQAASFDQDGDQLYMMGDSFPVAYNDEDKSTHQNPLSGIGALLRNALFLHLAASS